MAACRRSSLKTLSAPSTVGRALKGQLLLIEKSRFRARAALSTGCKTRDDPSQSLREQTYAQICGKTGQGFSKLRTSPTRTPFQRAVAAEASGGGDRLVCRSR
jgi:hypothetical protein